MNYKFVYARKGYRKDGTALVQLRVTVDRKSKYFTTDIYLHPRQWSEPKQEVVNHPKRFILNSILRDISDKVEEYQYKQLKGNKPISINEIESLINNKNVRSFLDFCRSEAESPKLRPGTSRHLRSFCHTLELFGLILTFDDITLESIQQFDTYLNGLKLNKNTLRKKHSTLRRMINAAIQKGYIDNNPYLKFKMPRVEDSTRRYLSKEDIAKLEAFVPRTKRQKWVQDCFLFQVFTGIAYQDMKKLKQKDVQINNNTLFIILNRTKTGEQSAIPVLKQAKLIIEKYKDKDPESKLLPVITNQRMNVVLKEIAGAAGIEKRLTTHVARHTFATTITLENGVPIETVSRMLGHSKISTTQIYAKITTDKLAADMKALEEKFNNL